MVVETMDASYQKLRSCWKSNFVSK